MNRFVEHFNHWSSKPKVWSLFVIGLIVTMTVGFWVREYVLFGSEAASIYAWTGLIAYLVGFFALVFIPIDNYWVRPIIWIVGPFAGLVVIYYHQPLVAWLFGCILGLLSALEITQRRRDRKMKRALHNEQGFLIILKHGRLSQQKTKIAKLDLTNFRAVLANLDGTHTYAITVGKDNKRLNICGGKDNKYVIFYTDQPEDKNQWQQLSTTPPSSHETIWPAHGQNETEIEIGETKPHYPARFVLDQITSQQTGEYFITHNQINPHLTLNQPPKTTISGIPASKHQ